MDIDNKKKQPPRNYLSRREQIRLLLMMGALGLVVFLMFEAGNSENYKWIEQMGDNSEDSGPSSRATLPEDLDTSYQPTIPAEVPLDEVRIRPALEPEADDGTRFFPGIVPAYLSEVEDNRPHHPSESMAWFNLWEVIERDKSGLINGATNGQVSFVELFEQPEAYRGELVTIRGSAKRVEWQEPTQKNRGVDGYYKTILRMEGGPPQPVFLYSLELPKGFPIGDGLGEDIEATAFFYKNWPYQGKDGQSNWIAPVLFARDFTWFPAPDYQSPLLSPQTIAIIIIVTAILAITIAYVVYRRSRRLFDDPGLVRVHVGDDGTAPNLEQIEAAPTVDEQLKELAKKQ